MDKTNKTTTRTGVSIAATVIAVLAATTANAIPITSFTVEGNVYTLAAELTGSTATHDTYKVTYSVDTSGNTDPPFDNTASTYLYAVEFGLGAVKADGTGVDLTALSNAILLSAPAGSWSTTYQNLNANGCPGPSAPDGKLCILQSDASIDPLLQFDAGTLIGGVFTFMASVDVAVGSVIDGGKVKVNYFDTSLKQGGGPARQVGNVGSLVSQDVSFVKVPEPSSISLLTIGGLALLGLGYRRRRNR